MEIHARIKAAREEKGLSQTQVAEAIGIAYQNYWKVENGKTELSVSRLYQLSDLLDISVGELLGIEPLIDNVLLDRIKDLESQIGFYKEVLKGKKEKEEYQQRVANQLVEDAFDNAASDLFIGVWELTEKSTGKTYKVEGHLIRSIQKLDNHQEIIEGLWYGTYTKKRMVKNEDVPEIKKRAIEMDTGILSLLNRFGLIQDEEFSKEIEENAIGFSK